MGAHIEKVVAVPTRLYREITVAPGREALEQKRRNGKELVEDIQREGAGTVVAAH